MNITHYYTSEAKNNSSQFGSHSEKLTANSFREVYERFLQATGVKKDFELAAFLEISPASVSGSKRRQNIPYSWYLKVAEKSGVSVNWLRHGDEQNGEINSKPTENIIYNDKAKNEVQTQRIVTADTELVMVPLVEARLTAGTGSFETSDNICRRYAFRNDFLARKGNALRMVLMRVAGDSMEPEIKNDDTVLIDQSQTQIRAGQIYAVGVEDLVYLKMIDTLPGKILLKSYNPDYAPIEILTNGDLQESVRIIGHVIWVARELF